MLESLENFLLPIVAKANAYLSDYILIILLIGVGLLFTITTRFVQVRCFGEGMKQVFGNMKLKGGKNKSGLSSFQALATAIAAQVGTGNIVGASGAILVGGPGAIFWMWIIAFLGMSTIYAEAVLAQETRVTDDKGNIHGGPVYYIKRAFTGGFGKFLAVFFSIAVILALGFMGSMVQSNSIAESVNTAFGIPGWVTGLILAAVSAFIFIGGIQRIASVTEKIVPIMAGLFLLGGNSAVGEEYVISGLLDHACSCKIVSELEALYSLFGSVAEVAVGFTLEIVEVDKSVLDICNILAAVA
jgi:AGCS family alanine or glycine:cation symporter